MQPKNSELFDFLEEKYFQYNRTEFIESDPIQVPHLFQRREDIEIAAFLSATIAWGQRTTIIANAKKLLTFMDNSPFDFVSNATEEDLAPFEQFKHRTFNGIDAVFFIQSLQHIYRNGGLEACFSPGSSAEASISGFKRQFFSIPHPARTTKHVADPLKGSSAKRINMFLRWMVRSDKQGIDFGLWKSIPSSRLMLPLDVHTGNVARKLGLLVRNQNDWKAVEEVTSALRQFDASDPVKYDFALFGLGAFEKF